jgi:CspA family cold shock protein
MSDENKVCYGVVCWFSKGFGFITPDENNGDVFCHYSDIAMEGYKTLAKGQLVSYQIGTNRRGQPKAINVIVIK